MRTFVQTVKTTLKKMQKQKKQQPSFPRVGNWLFFGLMMGPTFSPMSDPVPNPFCGVYNLILPWAGGAALLGLLLAVLGFFLRNLMPHASMQMENGLKGVGIGLFLMGLILQPNFLAAVASALGATGMDFNCPAH
jgi:hypothetical protein